ncbi:hypothetical protein JW758_04405 [Candidatus Peregrinibacteria bacterium]|nr:hypothetical protein [Candidatus Peregrinibacteria bacterium]
MNTQHYYNYFTSNFFQPKRLVRKGFRETFAKIPEEAMEGHKANVENTIQLEKKRGTTDDLKRLKAELQREIGKEEKKMKGRTVIKRGLRKNIEQFQALIKKIDAAIKTIEEQSKKKSEAKKGASESVEEVMAKALEIEIGIFKARMSDKIILGKKDEFRKVIDEIQLKLTEAKKEKKTDAQKAYASLLKEAKKEWDDRYLVVGEVASSVEKEPTQNDIDKEFRKMIRGHDERLGKERARAKGNITLLSQFIAKYQNELREKIENEADPAKKAAYEKLIQSAQVSLRESVKANVQVSPKFKKLVAEVGEKLEKNKYAVAKFLRETDPNDKNWNALRIKFTEDVLGGEEKDAGAYTRAMQYYLTHEKKLSTKGVDKKIGGGTRDSLAKFAGIRPKNTSKKSKEANTEVVENAVERGINDGKLAVLKKRIDYSQISPESLAILNSKKASEDEKIYAFIKEFAKQRNADEDRVAEWLYS